MVRANQTVTDEIPMHKEQARIPRSGPHSSQEARPHMSTSNYFVSKSKPEVIAFTLKKLPDLVNKVDGLAIVVWCEKWLTI